jgi:hypothetical protein
MKHHMGRFSEDKSRLIGAIPGRESPVGCGYADAPSTHETYFGDGRAAGYSEGAGSVKSRGGDEWMLLIGVAPGECFARGAGSSRGDLNGCGGGEL